MADTWFPRRSARSWPRTDRNCATLFADTRKRPRFRPTETGELGSALLRRWPEPELCSPSGQMGHSSIQLTLDTYRHLFPDANRQVLSALDELIRADGAHGMLADETDARLASEEELHDPVRSL